MDTTDNRLASLESSRSANDVRFEYIMAHLENLELKVGAIHDFMTVSQARHNQAAGLLDYFKPLVLGLIGGIMAFMGYPHVFGK